MRVDRLEQHLLGLVQAAGSPTVLAAEAFAAAGYTDKPHGLRLRLAGGGQVYLQLVRTSPPGGDVWDSRHSRSRMSRPR